MSVLEGDPSPDGIRVRFASLTVVDPPQRPRTWVALDFETACEDASSACAIGIVRQPAPGHAGPTG